MRSGSAPSKCSAVLASESPLQSAAMPATCSWIAHSCSLVASPSAARASTADRRDSKHAASCSAAAEAPCNIQAAAPMSGSGADYRFRSRPWGSEGYVEQPAICQGSPPLPLFTCAMQQRKTCACLHRRARLTCKALSAGAAGCAASSSHSGFSRQLGRCGGPDSHQDGSSAEAAPSARSSRAPPFRMSKGGMSVCGQRPAIRGSYTDHCLQSRWTPLPTFTAHWQRNLQQWHCGEMWTHVSAHR